MTRPWAAAVAGLALLLSVAVAEAARIKDVATVKGVRENILIGYGIVVGLKGTGDSSVDVTSQSLGRLFGKLGLDVKGGGVKSKNAAAVIATAKLPPFARVGSKIDITVSSIGDASSIEGGVLLVTPLRAGDQNVYAVAQGSITLGGAVGGEGGGKTFPTVGRVVAGATIEKDVDVDFAGKKSLRLSLHQADFTTAARVVTLVNQELGGKYATARDSGTIDLVVPFHYEGNAIELLALVENIQVNIDSKAKVVLNERTGTIVMGDSVRITPVAIAHGDLAIEVKDEKGNVKGRDRVATLSKPTSVADLVKALNALGVQPKDLTAIFQTLRQTGALQAELEIL